MTGLCSFRVVIAALGLAATCCTTTYTESELAGTEARRDATLRADERTDQEIGEMGGANLENMDEDEESLEEGSDL